mmetsp:Transcript_16433/g.35529  ORF Transcript_16433/g.35529 Transcript_16433/m.35529 type:complete len:380 (-) Transcript_16433:131-1270(-)
MINAGQSNQTALLDSIVGHMKNKIYQEEGMLVSDIGPQMKKDPPEEVLHQGYNILRSLQAYTVGDPLRKEDLVLCYCEEATAFAMKKLRPNDCAFILRSDGSFTYAIYQGHENGDASISFLVDEQGSNKRVPISKFCQLVKVPALIVPGRRSSRGTVRHTLSRSLISKRGSMASRKQKTTLSSSMLPIRTDMGVESKLKNGMTTRVPLRKRTQMSRSITTSRCGADTRITPSLSSSSLPPMGTITQPNGKGIPVEFKTEDGQTKMVKIHQAGTDMLYKGPAGSVAAHILDARLDRLLEPGYTGRLMDGRVKQADNDHITMEPRPPGSVDEYAAAPRPADEWDFPAWETERQIAEEQRAIRERKMEHCHEMFTKMSINKK